MSEREDAYGFGEVPMNDDSVYLPAAPQPCLHKRVTGNESSIRCDDCGQTWINQPEPAPAAPEAPPELAALQAENQRLREALEKLGHASSHLVWATGVEIGGGHRTRAFKVQHHAKCRYWMEQVEAALAEKGSNS